MPQREPQRVESIQGEGEGGGACGEGVFSLFSVSSLSQPQLCVWEEDRYSFNPRIDRFRPSIRPL